MPQALHHLFELIRDTAGKDLFGNPPLRWLIAIVVFILSYLILRLFKVALGRRVAAFAKRSVNHVDDILSEMLNRTSRLFLLAAALMIASIFLHLPIKASTIVTRIFSLAVFFQGGVWLSHGITAAIRLQIERRESADPSHLAVMSLFSFFSQVAVWTTVLLLTLENFGFQITGLIASLGIGGIAVGLALQNVLKDTFASLAIILDKPFVLGDFIVVGDFAGTVEHIGIKTTRLRSLSGEQLVFGNDDLLSSRVRNYKRMNERRIVFSFGVLYQTTAEQLEAIPGMIREILDTDDRARLDRAHFKQFGDSSLDFEVVYYVTVPDYNTYMDVQQEMNLALFKRFAKEGIEFAYPTRTIFIEKDDGGDEKGDQPVAPTP